MMLKLTEIQLAEKENRFVEIIISEKFFTLNDISFEPQNIYEILSFLVPELPGGFVTRHYLYEPRDQAYHVWVYSLKLSRNNLTNIEKIYRGF